MHKLWVRLSGSFLLVALVGVLVEAHFIGKAVETGFRGYIARESLQTASSALIERLEAYYRDHGSWEGVDELLTGQRGPQHGREGRHGGPPPGMGGPFQYVLFDAEGRPVAASDASLLDGASLDRDRATPLRDGETLIGWLTIEMPGQGMLSVAQMEFLDEIRRTVVRVALLATGLALGVGIAISRVLVRPMRQLTEAAQAVAAGELGRQVPVNPRHASEITALAGAFNEMSQALAESEALRQRMTADIAHELRTPLSVIRSQLQAMLDGVYPTDAEHVAAVYDQVLHLTRLVNDLRTLTQAEAGHLPLEMQTLSPAELIEREATLFEPLAQDAGLRLVTGLADDLPAVRGDRDRLHQVLSNLLANALQHTEPGGTITLRASRSEKGVRFAVINSGATLTPEQARHVFERFWRADESRQRDRGGAGLGLAISRELVHLHGGRIWVEVTDDETRFIFELPSADADA